MPAQTKGKARPVITGSAPRGSLARRVAARSIFNSGQSRECPVHTGAGEGASGAKRRRTEQGQKAATMAGITPRRSLDRMVAAKSKFKGGQTGECQDRTGADEGASGAKRHRTEQGHKAATHSHTAPCTTCQ